MRVAGRKRRADRAVIALVAMAWAGVAQAEDSPAPDQAPPQRWAIHGQATLVAQGNTGFPAPYDGPNSFKSKGETRETVDVTLYAGASPWRGAELWVNPEIDQGFGIGDTTGAAGFPSGEAYKVGKANPYFRLQRLFFRQTIGLGGGREAVEADLNQLRGAVDHDRLVITIGKFSVGDVFDTNQFAHDPRRDFLNWTLIDGGAFDYAADAWGYSFGATTELYRGRWTVRGGLFNLSDVPNSERLNSDFSEYEALGEIEERHSIAGRAGRIRVTGWFNHGRMAKLDDAIAAAGPGGVPDPALVRRYATRAGIVIGLEQQLTNYLGAFARASVADDRFEAYEFTDIDRAFSGGVVADGAAWGRAHDKLGFGVAVNAIDAPRRRYLAAGGLGILVGDGALPHPGAEHIAELWYDWQVTPWLHATGDAQVIEHPGYNRDRGPVPVLAVRLHAQF